MSRPKMSRNQDLLLLFSAVLCLVCDADLIGVEDCGLVLGGKVYRHMTAPIPWSMPVAALGSRGDGTLTAQQPPSNHCLLLYRKRWLTPS